MGKTYSPFCNFFQRKFIFFENGRDIAHAPDGPRSRMVVGCYRIMCGDEKNGCANRHNRFMDIPEDSSGIYGGGLFLGGGSGCGGGCRLYVDNLDVEDEGLVRADQVAGTAKAVSKFAGDNHGHLAALAKHC